MLSHPSVLPFASRQTQPLSSSSKATPLNSSADPAGPGGFLLPRAPSLAASHSSAFISLHLTLLPFPTLQGQRTFICRPWETNKKQLPGAQSRPPGSPASPLFGTSGLASPMSRPKSGLALSPTDANYKLVSGLSTVSMDW